MTRTQLLPEFRRMRFEEAYGAWQARRLTELLRVFRRPYRFQPAPVRAHGCSSHCLELQMEAQSGRRVIDDDT